MKSQSAAGSITVTNKAVSECADTMALTARLSAVVQRSITNSAALKLDTLSMAMRQMMATVMTIARAGMEVEKCA